MSFVEMESQNNRTNAHKSSLTLPDLPPNTPAEDNSVRPTAGRKRKATPPTRHVKKTMRLSMGELQKDAEEDDRFAEAQRQEAARITALFHAQLSHQRGLSLPSRFGAWPSYIYGGCAPPMSSSSLSLPQGFATQVDQQGLNFMLQFEQDGRLNNQPRSFTRRLGSNLQAGNGNFGSGHLAPHPGVTFGGDLFNSAGLESSTGPYLPNNNTYECGFESQPSLLQPVDQSVSAGIDTQAGVAPLTTIASHDGLQPLPRPPQPISWPASPYAPSPLIQQQDGQPGNNHGFQIDSKQHNLAPDIGLTNDSIDPRLLSDTFDSAPNGFVNQEPIYNAFNNGADKIDYNSGALDGPAEDPMQQQSRTWIDEMLDLDEDNLQTTTCSAAPTGEPSPHYPEQDELA